MTVGPLSRWREDSAKRWLHELLMPGGGCAGGSAGPCVAGPRRLQYLDRPRGAARRMGGAGRLQGSLAPYRQRARWGAEVAAAIPQFYGHDVGTFGLCGGSAGCGRCDAGKPGAGSAHGRGGR